MPAGDASLASGQPIHVCKLMLTVKLPVVSRSASRCSAGLQIARSSCVFRSFHSQRSARPIWSGGFKPERRPVPGHVCCQGGFRHFMTDCLGPAATYTTAGRRFGAAPVRQRHTRRRFCRQPVQTGRRLMRQTVKPTNISQRPRRREAKASRVACSPGSGSVRRPGSRFGLPLTPEFRWTVASPGRAECARRPMRPPPPRAPKCPTKC